MSGDPSALSWLERINHVTSEGHDTDATLSHAIQRVIRTSCQLLQTRFIAWTKPPQHGLVRALTSDRARGKAELVADNALVRQQLIVLS